MVIIDEETNGTKAILFQLLNSKLPLPLQIVSYPSSAAFAELMVEQPAAAGESLHVEKKENSNYYLKRERERERE